MPQSLTPARGRRALAMVEIVVCVIILAVGLIPIFRWHIVNSETVRFNRDEVTAGTLASQVIERLKLEPLEQLAARDLTALVQADPVVSPWSAAGAATDAQASSYEQSTARFRREVSFTPLDKTGGLIHTGRLECAVSWTDSREGGAHTRTVRVGTIVGRRHYPKGAP